MQIELSVSPDLSMVNRFYYNLKDFFTNIIVYFIVLYCAAYMIVTLLNGIIGANSTDMRLQEKLYPMSNPDDENKTIKPNGFAKMKLVFYKNLPNCLYRFFCCCFGCNKDLDYLMLSRLKFEEETSVESMVKRMRVFEHFLKFHLGEKQWRDLK